MEAKVKLNTPVQGLIRNIARTGSDLTDYIEIWAKIYSPEDFTKILRIITLTRGRHLKIVK